MNSPAKPEMSHEEMAELVAFPHSHMIDSRASDVLIANIAQALRDERRKVVEECAKVAKSQGQIYHNNMEGAGQPEFGQMDFAMGACHYIEMRIRALMEVSEEK